VTVASISQHRVTIDRIVRNERGGRLAALVFDDGRQIVVPLDLLPRGARQNQVLLASFEIDEEETHRRQEEIRALQNELFGD
jgi:hypothetical protein